MKKKAIVLGGGFAGCTSALFLKEKAFDVVLLEKTEMLGGGCRTYFYKGHPYTLGPRHLNIDVSFERTWRFLNEHLDLRMIKHRVYTLAANQKKFFTYPPTIADIEEMEGRETILQELENRKLNKEADNFEDFWINSVGRTLYEGFVKNYSTKMWDISDNQELDLFIGKSVQNRVLKFENDEYFAGKQHVAYPKNLDAYNTYFEKCVEGCKVFLNTIPESYNIPKKQVKIKGEWISADIIVSTIPIEELFDYTFGELKYMGRDFIKIILPIEKITPEPYYFLYYAGDEPYTRIFEYKLLTGYNSDHTLLGIEIPSKINKLYAYPIKSEIKKAKKYQDLMPEGVYCVGRLGTYSNVCMGEIVESCFDLIDKI